ncbi:MAG: CAP domain-containing protein [Rhizobiales bacterium]|nr:CAP domain-containing protein [Hyphomicrobiales bacterium]
MTISFGRLVSAAALLGSLAGLTACGSAVMPDRDPPSGQPSFYHGLAKPGAKLDSVAAQSMISGYRRNNGLSAVTLDSHLMRMAEEQARAMAAANKLDHNIPRDFTSRLRASGYDAGVAVENISAGYHTLAEAFSGWRDSPPHKRNMLKQGVTHMGIAAVYAPNTKYRVFWSLVLAGPEERRR